MSASSKILPKLADSLKQSPLPKGLWRNKTLYEAVSLLPNAGIDGKVSPRKWLKGGRKDTYYLIREIREASRITRRPDIYGTLVWRGEVKKGVQRLSGALKNYWEPLF